MPTRRLLGQHRRQQLGGDLLRRISPGPLWVGQPLGHMAGPRWPIRRGREAQCGDARMGWIIIPPTGLVSPTDLRRAFPEPDVSCSDSFVNEEKNQETLTYCSFDLDFC